MYTVVAEHVLRCKIAWKIHHRTFGFEMSIQFIDDVRVRHSLFAQQRRDVIRSFPSRKSTQHNGRDQCNSDLEVG